MSTRTRTRRLLSLLISTMTLAPLVIVATPAPSLAALSRAEIGTLERTASSSDYDEFSGGGASPVHVVGSGTLSTVRQWIGHSPCGTCSPGTSKYQRLQLDDLVAGAQYVVSVHPTYVTGHESYSASVTSGTAALHVGEQFTFRQTGWFTTPEVWRIEFVPSTTSIELRLGNGQTSGTNYLYLDQIIAAPKLLRVPSDSDAGIIGDRDAFGSAAAWDELTATSSLPNHIVGSGSWSTVRPWIGHSTCGSCGAGTAQKQRITMQDLQPGDTYYLTVFPAQVTGSAYYSAVVGAGGATIVAGNDKYFTGLTGYLTPEHRWMIEFVPSTTSVSLDLGHGLTSGNHYLYVNWYTFTPEEVPLTDETPAQFSNRVQSLDTENSGDWWKDDVYVNGYLWGEGYVMGAYVDTYRATLDEAWLEKLVDHADSVLSQRSSVTGIQDCYGETPPAWRDENNPSPGGYVWIGFTGAMFAPLMDFASTVLASPHLSSRAPAWLGGQTLEDKALDYVDAFQDAVDYHESEWVSAGSDGYYAFQSDIATTCGVAGSSALAGQPVAFDMNSLMMRAVLLLSNAYRADGDTRASTYELRAEQYATYFRSEWTYHAAGDYVDWPFAVYYGTGRDDIGHANFNIQFVATAYREGLVYTPTDVARIANTYSRLVQEDYSIPFNMMDATYSSIFSSLNNPVFYWNTVAPERTGLIDRAYGRLRVEERDRLIGVSTLTLVDYLGRH